EGVDALALGRSSALVGRGRRIERWDLRLGERRLLPGEATRNLTCLLLEPTEAAVLSGDHAGELRRWSLRGGSEPTVLGRHEGPVQALALDLAGRRLLSAGRDG
ncbi:MAG TPA: hypothetical protein DEA08_25190, partial [Planctomycetes bacterium]|nr:hypothetical protein [Planctomycetota bacterium]